MPGPACRQWLTPCAVQGKVRDVYDAGDRLVIVTTDRQSAFDRLLASVPFKVTPCDWSLDCTGCHGLRLCGMADPRQPGRLPGSRFCGLEHRP